MTNNTQKVARRLIAAALTASLLLVGGSTLTVEMVSAAADGSPRCCF